MVATVEEGQTLYCSAGHTIAVEKFDMRIGSSEFDFQVTSRPFRGERPEEIMAQQETQDREFMESRVKSNLYGLPLSLGNMVQMTRERRIDLSYGELKPQVFRTGLKTLPIAWRIWFKRNWYTGAASGRGVRGATGANVAVKARATAVGSSRIGASSADPTSGAANGQINPLGNDAGILRVYAKLSDTYRVFARPFDDHDVIFRERSIAEHLGSLFGGRGW